LPSVQATHMKVLKMYPSLVVMHLAHPYPTITHFPHILRHSIGE